MDPNFEALFFREPREIPTPPGQFGILYLLRRDIRSCFDNAILWPGVMSILAGIDLLAKFYAGQDGQGVGDRFRDFVRQFFHLPTPDDDVETIYQLRNSILHSFGLYSSANNGQIYRFTLTSLGTTPLIQRTSPEHYLIDIRSLFEYFENSIIEYRRALQGDVGLQNKFMAMFPNYGSIRIGG